MRNYSKFSSVVLTLATIIGATFASGCSDQPDAPNVIFRFYYSGKVMKNGVALTEGTGKVDIRYKVVGIPKTLNGLSVNIGADGMFDFTQSLQGPGGALQKGDLTITSVTIKVPSSDGTELVGSEEGASDGFDLQNFEQYRVGGVFNLHAPVTASLDKSLDSDLRDAVAAVSFRKPSSGGGISDRHESGRPDSFESTGSKKADSGQAI